MSTTAYRNVLIHKSFNEVVFAINAVAPTREEQGQLQSCILKAVERDSIRMPFRICAFDLDLEQHSGVVQKEECYKIGERLGMEREKVEYVLKFFNRCAFKFSYPDAFPHLPFAKMNPLLRRLSSLIDITQENDPTGNSDRLRMKGLFNTSFLQSVVSDVDDGENLEYSDFLTLLEIFNIAIRVTENDFFLPCVLPLKPPPDEPPLALSCIPLIYTWDKEVLPPTFFHSFVVALLQEGSLPCFELLEGVGQSYDVIRLTASNQHLPGILQLVNGKRWIEVGYSQNPRYCHMLREITADAGRRVSKMFNQTALLPPEIGFLCCLCDDPDHYCVPSSDRLMVTCSRDHSRSGPITPDMLCWLEESNTG